MQECLQKHTTSMNNKQNLPGLSGTRLHYDEAQDASCCYTCSTADEQSKLKTEYSYKESAFMSNQ